MAPPPESAPEPPAEEQLAQVKVADLERNKQRVQLYSNPLGRACYQLDLEKAESCIGELKQGGLLEAGLVFASQVRPLLEDRQLSSKEWRQFQMEIGAPPMILACAACAAGLSRIRQELQVTGDGSQSKMEKEVQIRAADIVRALVRHGARITAADVGPLGNTALHVAARCGAPQLLSALLALDADMTARNNEGCSPETVASRFNNIACAQIMQVTCILDMDQEETVVRDIEADQQKQQEQKQKVKDRRKRKKQKRRGQIRPRAGDGDSDASVLESISDGAVEEEAEPPLLADLADRADGADGSKSGRGAGISQAACGRNSGWSRLDEDPYQEDWQGDVDLPDEWDTARWGEYEDWGEDWDEDGQSSGLDGVSGDDDDDEVRAEVARLRKEKAAQLQQLYDIAADREARLHETEHMEKQGQRLAERVRRLEDREIKIKAGDPEAADATADEVEVSSCIERLATMHARSVWEFEKTLAKQQLRQAATISAMEKDLRAMKRRTKGLEHYWDYCFMWQSSTESFGRVVAIDRARKLVEDIDQVVDNLEVSPQRKRMLPPMFAPPGADGQPMLMSLRELMIAMQVHHRILCVQRSYEAELVELTDLCTEQLRAKHEEIITTVETDLVHKAFPDQDAENLDGWRRLAELAARSQWDLEHASGRSQATAYTSSSYHGGNVQASGSWSRSRV